MILTTGTKHWMSVLPKSTDFIRKSSVQQKRLSWNNLGKENFRRVVEVFSDGLDAKSIGKDANDLDDDNTYVSKDDKPMLTEKGLKKCREFMKRWEREIGAGGAGGGDGGGNRKGKGARKKGGVSNHGDDSAEDDSGEDDDEEEEKGKGKGKGEKRWYGSAEDDDEEEEKGKGKGKGKKRWYGSAEDDDEEEEKGKGKGKGKKSWYDSAEDDSAARLPSRKRKREAEEEEEEEEEDEEEEEEEEPNGKCAALKKENLALKHELANCKIALEAVARQVERREKEKKEAREKEDKDLAVMKRALSSWKH